MKNIFIQILFILLFSQVILSQATNVKYKLDGESYIITYDLPDDGEFYDIEVLATKGDFKYKPYAIAGDVGKVIWGKNKTIYYEPLLDIFTINDIKLSVQAEIHLIDWILVEGGDMGDFYISQTEVTFAQYDEFCNETGYKKPYDEGWGRVNKPVINVNTEDANKFCEWLSERTGKKIRLPEESEWEYAARGGNKSKGYIYSGSNNLDEVGWYYDNSGNKTHVVGAKRPNELGIYDMSGNVWERVGKSYVLRGGSWHPNHSFCEVSGRYNYPNSHLFNVGFRILKNK